MKLKKKVVSVLLAVAVMITFMPTVTLSVNAASKASKKVQTVTTEKNQKGDNTKYTYNKKGFVTKVVTKTTTKANNSDTATTITTSYKYNKKNRISKKTVKSVDKVTTYKLSKTTGKSTGEKLGTVTTTTTDVTKYTYKKGRATKAVTTSTTVKSGSNTELNVKMNLEDEGELIDGRRVAGFNERNADGTYAEKSTSANAYYYVGSLDAAVSTENITTVYKNNGDGTYTETVTTTPTSSNYNLKYNKTYYKQLEDSDKYVTCTKDEYDDTPSYERFSRVDSVEVVLGNTTDVSNTTSTNTDTVSKKAVTTTTYKYDKKKRVKQANVTRKESTTSDSSYTTVETYKETNDEDDDVVFTETGSTTNTSSGKETETIVNSQVEKYTYDKKNRKTKSVATDKGVANYTSVYEPGEGGSSTEYTTTYADGRKTSGNYSNVYNGGDVITHTSNGGYETSTTTHNPYKSTYKSNSTDSDGNSYSTESSTETTYYANGGKSSVSNLKETNTNKDGSGDSTERSTTRYTYDEKGERYSYTTTYNNSYTEDGKTSTSSGTNSYYNDGKETKNYYSKSGTGYETIDNEVKAKADAETATLIASGTPYVETKTKAVKATPSKSTTKYKYDKQGNLKTAKSTYSDAEVVTLRNETFGNVIKQFGVDDELENVTTVVNHSYKYNKLKENTVKKGTNRVSKSMAVATDAYDRESLDYGYAIDGRVTYKLKAKTIAKKKIRTDVELQQWLIQNPGCGSVEGLI